MRGKRESPDFGPGPRRSRPRGRVRPRSSRTIRPDIFPRDSKTLACKDCTLNDRGILGMI